MNDKILPPTLAKTALHARVARAKDEFSKASVAVLRGDPGAGEAANAAMLDLEAARAELASMDTAPAKAREYSENIIP